MSRLDVHKTYKLYIGGKFPRTESGRYYPINNAKGDLIANVCLASRKDFRNAVVVARKAQQSWANVTALNKGQILYRIAEMLEGRKEQFIAAVSSAHFNFSNLEPVGIVAIIAPEKQSLLGLISMIAPTMVGGNTVIILASESSPLTAISFAEVLNSSDVPNGVVNILTGKKDELIHHMASHMDVNSIIYCGQDQKVIKTISELASENLKRTAFYKKKDWSSDESESPYFIEKTQEIKTTWHPTDF
jgi:acyl-CoA reductase-like NAD-dependent aldehyde dehydrogenase